jgi:CRP-like cAMP-binding protein
MIIPGAFTAERSPAANPVLSRLSELTSLSAAEAKALDDLTAFSRSFPARAELRAQGLVQSPQLLLSGWACYQRILGDGRRQIVGFLLPGDSIGSLINPGLAAPSGVVALTPVVTVDARPLILAAEGTAPPMPGLAAAIKLMAHRDEVLLRDQIVRLGRQTAYERMVHLILEFRERLALAGMARRDTFNLPLTQETLADALGLSVVHVNRTLQQIRRDGLLELRGGQVTLLQPDLMRGVADWASPG